VPALPLVVTGHPLAGLPHAQVIERATVAAGEVHRILTMPCDRLLAEYQGRHYTQPRQLFAPRRRGVAACTDPLACGDA